MIDTSYNSALGGYIISSSTALDILIEDFKNAIEQGFDPNEVKDSILEQRHIGLDELTASDLKTLEETVNAMCK